MELYWLFRLDALSDPRTENQPDLAILRLLPGQVGRYRKLRAQAQALSREEGCAVHLETSEPGLEVYFSRYIPPPATPAFIDALESGYKIWAPVLLEEPPPLLGPQVPLRGCRLRVTEAEWSWRVYLESQEQALTTAPVYPIHLARLAARLCRRATWEARPSLFEEVVALDEMEAVTLLASLGSESAPLLQTPVLQRLLESSRPEVRLGAIAALHHRKGESKS